MNKTSTTEYPIINDKIIKILLSEYVNHNIDGSSYKYLGKGVEGVAYELNGKVVKIYKNYDTDAIVKEFYIFGLLNELMDVNVIRMYNYYLAYSNPVIIMELMDGDLTKWCTQMIKTKNTDISDDRYDELWLGMIFQVTYGILFLNRLKILHTDTKSRNILFKSLSNNVNDKLYNKYVINGQTYSVPTNYEFQIADFGAAQIFGLSSNKLSNEQITEDIQNRTDLYPLSRTLYRIIILYGAKDYGWGEINSILKTNKEFREYQSKKKNEINIELKDMPQNTREKMSSVLLRRSLIYYAIENNMIDSNEIIKKHDLRMPSKKVSDILDKLLDLTIQNVFELFTMFKS